MNLVVYRDGAGITKWTPDTRVRLTGAAWIAQSAFIISTNPTVVPDDIDGLVSSVTPGLVVWQGFTGTSNWNQLKFDEIVAEGESVFISTKGEIRLNLYYSPETIAT